MVLFIAIGIFSVLFVVLFVLVGLLISGYFNNNTSSEITGENLNMDGKSITNLKSGREPGDAVNKEQLDNTNAQVDVNTSTLAADVVLIQTNSNNITSAQEDIAVNTETIAVNTAAIADNTEEIQLKRTFASFGGQNAGGNTGYLLLNGQADDTTINVATPGPSNSYYGPSGTNGLNIEDIYFTVEPAGSVSLALFYENGTAPPESYNYTLPAGSNQGKLIPQFPGVARTIPSGYYFGIMNAVGANTSKVSLNVVMTDIN